ncbi:MAG: hypothetical protein JSW39_14100 [Desulfobacterales bacterium]|nr:MAG: hypothetical protein JSW39_14100 [Desulfobacterales bacterium]
MQNIELLYLSQEDVIATGMTMEASIAAVEDALREHGLGETENPPKPGIHPQRAFIHAMPGYLPRKKAAGLKWVSSFSGNTALGIPSVMGLLILNDTQTGQPLAVMDCGWITAMRTGAVSPVAAKYLAPKDSRVVGIVGAGIQGRYNLLALHAAMPAFETVRVFDINPHRFQPRSGDRGCRHGHGDLCPSANPRVGHASASDGAGTSLCLTPEAKLRPKPDWQ